MAKILFVGLDISSDENVAQFMNAEGQTLRSSLTFANSETGLRDLIQATDILVIRHEFTELQIGMEATGFYWWHLREYLDQEPAFDGLEVKVFVANPSLVKGFKKAYTTLPKTDAVDAWVIADRLRFGRLQPVRESDLKYEPLSRLTRFRFNLVKSLIVEKNRACGLIFLKFSDYKQAAGRRAFGKAGLAVLNEFTPNEISEMPLDELVRFVVANTNNRFQNPEGFAEELQAAARRSYRLNAKMQNSVDVTMAMTCENIRFLEAQCKKIDLVLKRELAAIPQTLTTVPGIGHVLAAGIISEAGDITRFPNDKSLAKFAGLTWHRHQSGRFEAEETSLTKAGNRFLRYYLVEAANSLRVHNSEYKAFYEKKYGEVTKHQHKRALVLTARKFVRLVHALLSKGQIYQERREA